MLDKDKKKSKNQHFFHLVTEQLGNKYTFTLSIFNKLDKDKKNSKKQNFFSSGY